MRQVTGAVEPGQVQHGFSFNGHKVQPTDILHFWNWWPCYLLVRYGPGTGMDKVSCAGVITKLQYK